MKPKQYPQRRRGDSNDESPLLLVRSHTVTVPPEGPVNHLRNALQLVRVSMGLGEFVYSSGNLPAVIVEFDVLDGIARRIDATLGILELERHHG